MEAPTFCLHTIGRVHGVTRRRLEQACRRAGGRVVNRPSRKVDRVAIGEGSARTILAQGARPTLPAGLRADVALVSETALKRELGLSPAAAPAPRTLTEREVSRASGLEPDELQALALYAVVEPEGGLYRFEDLLAAREVKRLTREGHPLALVVEAAVLLRRAGRGLADTRSGDLPEVDLAAEVSALVNGQAAQIALDLGDIPEDEDTLFARAEEAEAAGDHARAERLYRLLARLDRSDPVIPFNLGNVLAAEGRDLEASLAYREALVRDRHFAEAWLNLALAAEARGRPEEADRSYAQALAARSDYPEALFSAALFHGRRGRPALAVPLWERYLAGPSPADAAFARRMLRRCRTECAEAEARTALRGGTPAS
jgi:tetratricopeptide (TPR) repeat protein